MATDEALPAPSRRPFRSRATIPLIVVGLIGVLMVLYAWRLPPFTSTVQTTDNAFVRGQVTVISPRVEGYVVQVPVKDFAVVEAGELLVQLDDRIYRQRLQQAQANLSAQEAALANSLQQRRSAEANVGVTEAQIASARATLFRAQADQRRFETLFAQGWASQQQIEQYRAATRQAEAAVEQMQASRTAAQQNVTSAVVNRRSLEAAVQNARAAIQLAEIELDNTHIRAPRAGELGEVGVRVGQYATPGTQLMSLVPQQVWVTANFKETQMARVAPGQPAVLRVDALDGARLRGRVERISPAAGSEFSVIRPDNATGNFTKVAQRIPVRIMLDPGQPLIARLRPGMSVVASVDTASAPPP